MKAISTFKVFLVIIHRLFQPLALIPLIFLLTNCSFKQPTVDQQENTGALVCERLITLTGESDCLQALEKVAADYEGSSGDEMDEIISAGDPSGCAELSDEADQRFCRSQFASDIPDADERGEIKVLSPKSPNSDSK